MVECLLAALSGVLYVLAFPGFDLWPLAFVALVPVLYGLVSHEHSLGLALRIGLVLGLVTQLFGFWWLLSTLRVFAALPVAVCVLVYLVICLGQAGQQVLFVALVWWVKRRGHDPLLFAPLAYGAAELAYPALFPSYFAASLHRVPLFLQLADLGGPSLVSMLLVALNASVCSALRNTRRAGASPLRPLAAGVLLLFSMAGYGALRAAQLEQEVAHAPKLAVGIVQANMERLEKREARAEGRRRHLEQSAQLEQGLGRPARGSRAPDLLVWPETALQYVLPDEIKNVHAMLGSLTTPLLFGGLGHRVVRGRAQLHNSAFLADADGRVLGRSDKMRLIPFAEHIPLGDRFPRLYDLLPNTGEFTPAAHPIALAFHGHRIAALICYEDVLSGFVRDVMQRTDAHLLVNLSNDAWFGRTREPQIHFALAKLRAIEQRRYLVRASNSGISGVIDAFGRVVVESSAFTRSSLRAEVALLSGSTMYRRFGDWPVSLALSVLLWALLPTHVRGRRQ